MADENQSNFKLMKGYLALVTLLFTISLGSTSVQALKGAMPDFQLTAARCLLQVLVYSSLLICTGMKFTVKRERIPALLYSCVLYVTYNVGFYGSTVYVPLMEAFGVFSIVNVIAAILHGKFMFNKDPKVPRLFSIGIMLIAMLLLVQPSWLFPSTNQMAVDHTLTGNITGNVSETEDARKLNNFGHDTIIGYVLAMVAGIASGCYLDVTALLLHDVPPLVKTFYVSAGGLMAATFLSVYIEEISIYLTLHEALLVMGHCSAACFSVFMVVYSAHVLGGVRCSVGRSLQILVMMLFQYTLMGNIMPGHHNWIEVIGAILLILGVSCASLLDLVQMYKKADVLP